MNPNLTDTLSQQSKPSDQQSPMEMRSEKEECTTGVQYQSALTANKTKVQQKNTTLKSLGLAQLQICHESHCCTAIKHQDKCLSGFLVKKNDAVFIYFNTQDLICRRINFTTTQQTKKQNKARQTIMPVIRCNINWPSQ